MSSAETPKPNSRVPRIGFAPAAPRPVSESSVSPGEEWRLKRACKDLPPGVFNFTYRKKAETEAAEARAKDICKGCPVKEPCLDWALITRQKHGVLGGLNEKEREELLGN